MAISGSFLSAAATRQPMAAKPPPEGRHGAKERPDTAWSAPAAGTGSGAPWAEAVDPAMAARGLVLDLGHQYGHAGTAAVRAARRPFVAGAFLGRRTDAPYQERCAAQAAAAAAHGDTAAGYYQGHQYDPAPQQTAGSSYEVMRQNTWAVPTMGARAVIHGRPGGQFSDGQGGGDFGPTGFSLGVPGRFAVHRYSSPALGAMYSKNTLRGVLPQVVAVPGQQPALAGPRESGIPANRRFLPPFAATPRLFRSPPSESEQTMAAAAAAGGGGFGDTMGVGF